MLMPTVDSYLALRRAAGYRLRVAEGFLRHYARFASERGETHLRAQTMLEWAMSRSALLNGPAVTLRSGNRVTTQYRFPNTVEHTGREAPGRRQRKLTSAPAWPVAPRIGFSRDWEIYRDEDKHDGRREKAGVLKHTGLIAVSFQRLFLSGLLPSRARFRFAV
jgi:hypothetical protein